MRLKFSYQEDFYINNINIIRIPVKKIPFKNNNYLSYSKKIINIFKVKNFIPNKIITHGVFLGGVYAKEIYNIMNIRYSICLHYMDILDYKKSRELKEFYDVLNNSNKIFFRNERIKEYFKKNIESNLFNPKDYGIIFSGVDVDTGRGKNLDWKNTMKK